MSRPTHRQIVASELDGDEANIAVNYGKVIDALDSTKVVDIIDRLWGSFSDFSVIWYMSKGRSATLDDARHFLKYGESGIMPPYKELVAMHEEFLGIYPNIESYTISDVYRAMQPNVRKAKVKVDPSTVLKNTIQHEEVIKKACDTAGLRLIIMVDVDNVASSYGIIRNIQRKAKDIWDAFVVFVGLQEPMRVVAYHPLPQWAAAVVPKTRRKEASDLCITAIAVALHYSLPKTVHFAIITRDNFTEEIMHYFPGRKFTRIDRTVVNEEDAILEILKNK